MTSMSASLLAEPAGHGAAVPEIAPRPRRVVVLASLARSLILFRWQLLRAMAEAGHDVLALAPENDPGVAEALARVGVRYRPVPMARVALHPIATCARSPSSCGSYDASARISSWLTR
jgi:hypothetical protein